MKEDRQTSTELGENLDEVKKSGSVSPRMKSFYRMLKMTVFILCLTGFGIQTAEFLSTFYTYPTVLNIKSERLQQFPTPALTFCSKYMLNFDKYCEKYQNRCSRNNITNTVTPKIFPGYTVNTDFLYDAYFDTDEAIYVYEIENSNETFGEKFLFYDEMNSLRHVCYGYGYGLKDGYLLNMTVRDYEKKKRWAKFRVSFQQAENVLLDPQPFGTLYIHSPFLSFKTFEKKITVKPNYAYKIHTSLQEERLLPSPYDTNCTDYLSLWKENGGTGPLSREMCQSECIWGAGYYEREDKTSRAEVCYNFVNRERSEEDRKWEFWKKCKCYVECKDECLVFNYDYAYREENIYEGRHETFADINIYIKDNKVQINTYKPQYMGVERFSSVGGFMGCWLGISIWTMNGILWRAYYGAVAKSKGWTNSLRRRPPPLERASRHEADDETKEIP